MEGAPRAHDSLSFQVESQGWEQGSPGEGPSLTASNPSSGPQGANILINDSGEVKLGECGSKQGTRGYLEVEEGMGLPLTISVSASS